MLNGSLFAQQGSQAADLGTESGSDVLRIVDGKLSYARNQSSEDDVLIDELGEAWRSMQKSRMTRVSCIPILPSTDPLRTHLGSGQLQPF